MALATDEQLLAVINCRFAAKCGFIARAEVLTCTEDALAKIHDPCPDDFNFVCPIERKLEAGVAAGRIAIDEKAADACLARVDSASCGRFLSTLETCLKAFHGLVAAGGACDSIFDCQAGDCESKRCTSTSLPASPPTPLGAAGAHCGNDPDCADGLICAGACVTPLQTGAECGNGGQCAAGLYCGDWNIDRKTGRWSAQCAPWRDLGDACDPGVPVSGCPQDAVCDETRRRCLAR
jgi:hypothetical protein